MLSSAFHGPIGFLRAAALAEAVSYLVLLGIAMPLKYLAGLPMAVRVVGSFHGLLFVILCVALLWVWIRVRWPLLRLIGVFVASFIPILPFFMDARLRQHQEESQSKIHA
jgi:integral membrane protein